MPFRKDRITLHTMSPFSSGLAGSLHTSLHESYLLNGRVQGVWVQSRTIGRVSHSLISHTKGARSTRDAPQGEGKGEFTGLTQDKENIKIKLHPYMYAHIPIRYEKSSGIMEELRERGAAQTEVSCCLSKAKCCLPKGIEGRQQQIDLHIPRYVSSAAEDTCNMCLLFSSACFREEYRGEELTQWVGITGHTLS